MIELEYIDLLDYTFIESSIFNTDNYSNIFEEYVSESDMMCSIYENQRFLVEQDTYIFMALEYSIIDEGVISIIVKTISTIFEKIKRLIIKFINFITGRRKKDKGDKNKEEILKDTNNIKNSGVKASDVTDAINKMYEKIQNMTPDEKIEYELKEINDLKKIVDKIENDKRYDLIEIDDVTLRSLNITDKWEEIEKAIDNIEEMLNLIKSNKSVPEDKYITFGKDFNKIGDKIGSGVTVTEQVLTRDEFLKTDIKKIENFYKNYTKESNKNIDYLKNLYNNRIVRLEKEAKQIKIDQNNIGYDKSAVKKINDLIMYISNSCSTRISVLMKVEQGYQHQTYNLIRDYQDSKNLVSFKEEIDKRMKNIEKYNNEKMSSLQKQLGNIHSFDKGEFINHVFNKNKRRTGSSIISMLRNREFKPIPNVLNFLHKYFPEIFETYKESDYEIDETKWDKEYFIRQTFMIGENFCEERINYCIQIAKKIKY